MLINLSDTIDMYRNINFVGNLYSTVLILNYVVKL